MIVRIGISYMNIKFGVLGAGRIGQVHAAAIASVPSAELIAVAEPNTDAAKMMKAKYSCAIETIDEILANPVIDAVVICTPTDTHADLIEKFCKAGKSVFCEKPVDLDVARAKECLRVVEETNGNLMVGFQRRFDPDFMVLKKTIDDGLIGEVEMITLTSRDPGAPPYDYIKRSGGIFRDMTIHDFDVARWLLGEEVETVFAAASVLVDQEIGKLGDFDSVNVVLKTVSGRQCTINNSRRATYGYDQRIEVHGSKGSVLAKNHEQHSVRVANKDGYRDAPLQDFFMSRYTAAYANEITAFVDALQSGSAMPTDGQDGLMALALAEAAVRSVATGAAVNVAELLKSIK